MMGDPTINAQPTIDRSYLDKKKDFKLCVIIGHSARKQGAVSYNGYTEWAWNMQLCIDHFLGKIPNMGYLWREDLPYKKAIDTMNAIIAQNKPDICIELHFNAYNRKTEVKRAEVLSLAKEADKADAFAKIWANEMLDEYELSRLLDEVKIKYLKKSDKGYYNLKSLDDLGIPNVILEPCFADTPNALAENVIEDPKRYADLLIRCIKQYKERL